MTVRMILLAFAFVFFLLAGFNIFHPWINDVSPPRPPRISFVGLGLACWVLTLLLG